MTTFVQVGVGGRQITLLMVGLDNAGKTCTAKTIVGQVQYLQYIPVHAVQISTCSTDPYLQYLHR